MKTKMYLVLTSLGLALAPQFAHADVITYSTNAAGGNGFYNGTGGIDGDFTTSTETYQNGTIALSLRGAQRFVGPITPTTNNYTCVAGESCNFEWSVATTGTLDIADFTYELVVDDVTTGMSLSFDTIGANPSGSTGLDDSYWISGAKSTTYSGTATGFENSEFLGFAFLQTALDYSATDQVDVTLSARPTNVDRAGASVEIQFNSPVPEPASVLLSLTMVGLLGLSFTRRRQKA